MMVTPLAYRGLGEGTAGLTCSRMPGLMGTLITGRDCDVHLTLAIFVQTGASQIAIDEMTTVGGLFGLMEKSTARGNPCLTQNASAAGWPQFADHSRQ
jgi:hypothetical protein